MLIHTHRCDTEAADELIHITPVHGCCTAHKRLLLLLLLLLLYWLLRCPRSGPAGSEIVRQRPGEQRANAPFKDWPLQALQQTLQRLLRKLFRDYGRVLGD